MEDQDKHHCCYSLDVHHQRSVETSFDAVAAVVAAVAFAAVVAADGGLDGDDAELYSSIWEKFQQLHSAAAVAACPFCHQRGFERSCTGQQLVTD